MEISSEDLLESIQVQLLGRNHPCFESMKERLLGEYHPYRWPNAIGFHAYQQGIDQMIEYLKEDKLWYVTKKLDGCPVTISSEGWIASKNRIVGKRSMKGLYFSQEVSLKEDKLETLFENIHKLKNELELTHFENNEIELMLYGKMIIKEMGSSKKGVCNYREKNIYPGDFICFGIGLVLPKNIQLPSEFSNAILNNKREEEQNCFAVPISSYLCELLTCCAIDHNRIYKHQTLSNILNDGELFHDIRKKMWGGYILSGDTGEAMIELAPILMRNTPYGNLHHRKILEKVLEILKSIDHSTPKNAQIMNKMPASISTTPVDES